MAHNSQEKTFRAYTQEQGKAYAEARVAYHEDLYNVITAHHTSTGGQMDTLLDIGCGPGTAIRPLAARFAHAVGVDPSEGMIGTARSLGGVTSTGEAIRWEVGAGEELTSIPDGSVDMITAATAAHWFDMPRFWPEAARVLKSGGTVAFWVMASMRAHPSMEGSAEVQKALDEFEADVEEYMVEGNLMVRDLYKGMALPWELGVAEFDEGSYYRREWNTDSSNTTGEGNQVFLGDGASYGLDMVEKLLATTSPVSRWRLAHPEADGGSGDVVRVLRRKMELVVGEGGKVRGSASAVLMMVKRR
ncbi:hypothetical protein FQN54_003269 [Arachnomyces sp. PD_36]|nr:hypothetical protein FQN54_003269 [Arachnomyces sp. PD_36]